eukprot:g15669.t1
MLSRVVALAVELILLKHPVAASTEWDLMRRQAEISQTLKMLQRVRERSSGAPMAIPVPAALVGSGAGGWGMPGFDRSSDGGAGAFIDDNYVVDGTLFSEGGVEDDDPLPRRRSGGGRVSAISSLFHKVEVLRTLTSSDSTTFDSIQFLSSAAPPNDDSFAHYLMSFVDGGKAKRAKAARNEGKEKSLTDLRVLLTSRQHGRVLLGTPFYSSATGGANKLKLQLDPLVNATNASLANPLPPATATTSNNANAKKSDFDFYYGQISYVQPVNRRMFYVVRQAHSSSSQTHTHFLVEQYSCCLTPRLQHQTLLVVNGTGFVPSSKNMLLLPGGKEAYFADDFGRLKLLSSAGGAGAMVASMLQDPPTGAADRGATAVAPKNKTASSKKKNDVKLDWNGNALAPNFRAASLMREKLAVKVADTAVVALQPVGADRFFFHTRNHFGWFSVKAADSAVPLCGGWGGGGGGNAAAAQVAPAGGEGGGTAGLSSIEEAVLAQNGLRVFLLLSSGSSSDGKRSKILVYLAERSTLSSLKGAPQPKKSTSAEKICFLETAFPEVGGGLRNLHVIADRYVFALQGGDSSAPGASASAHVRLVFFCSEHEPGTLSAGRTFFVPDVLGELLGPSSPSATSSTTKRIVRFAVSPFNGAAKKQLLFVVSTVVKTGNPDSSDTEKEKLEVFEFTVKSLVDAAHAAHQTHSAANSLSSGPALGALQTQTQARTFRTTQRDQLRARKGAGSSEAADGDQKAKTSSATATATAGPWTWFGISIPFTSYLRNYLFPGDLAATTSASALESDNLMQTVDADDPTGERKGFWRKLWERIYLPRGLVMFGVVVVFCSYTVWKQRNKYNYTGGFRSGDDALAGQRAKRTEEQIMAGFRKVQKEVREHRGRRGGGSGVSSEDILREAGAGAGSGSSSGTSGGSDSEYEMVPRAGEMGGSDSDLVTGREFYPTRKNFWLPPPGYNNDGGGERTLLDELLDEEGLVDADGDGGEDPDTELRERTAVSQSASA